MVGLLLMMQAQLPKIDSLRLTLMLPYDAAYTTVATAFMDNGLNVTNSTPILIEANEGETANFATFGSNQRIVRAVLLRRDPATTLVQLTGRELRKASNGTVQKELRIDNRAGGNGGKVWRKMLKVAWALDSTQVPGEALPADWSPAGPPTAAESSDSGFAWVASTLNRRYYATTCPASNAIPKENRVFFGSEATAKQVGYVPATDEECQRI